MKYFLFSLLLLCLAPAGLYSQSARKLISEARSFSEAGNYTSAQEKFNQAIALEPDNADALYYRGKNFQLQGKATEALDDFKKASQAEPKNTDFKEALGLVQVELKLNSDAIATADQLLVLNPKTSSFYHIKEEAQFNQRNFEGVIQTCSAAFAVNKNDDRSNYFMAEAVASVGNTGLAETYYSKALAIALDTKGKKDNPQVLFPYYNGLGDVQEKLNKDDAALSSYNSAIALNANQDEIVVKRAALYFKKKEYQNALQDFQKAISINARNDKAYYQRSLVYIQLGQFDAAINDCNQSIQLNDKNANYYACRAECYVKSKKDKDAVRDYKKALQILTNQVEWNKALTEAKNRLFEAGKESNAPVITVLQPQGVKTDLMVLADVMSINLKGMITDASPIRSLVIDGQSQPLAEEALNPEFDVTVSLKDKSSIKIQVTDQYLNSAELVLKVNRIETNPPQISLVQPFQLQEGEVFVSENQVQVEGKIEDESRIRSILINGEAAAFPVDQLQPQFSASIQLAGKSSIEITVNDIHGNESKKSFRIVREDSSKQNSMGKTWVVVIENSQYKNYPELSNNENDVTAIKEALSSYTVANTIHRKNLSKAEMERFFTIELRDQILKNHVNALAIIYLGHGAFMNESGYWIPSDGLMSDDLATNEFSFYGGSLLRAALQSYTGIKHSLVLSDACDMGNGFYETQSNEKSDADCQATETARSYQVISAVRKELNGSSSLFPT
ncbi:MAG: hypothetical protein RLZZ543_1585, partial [Bacteroidota bacterium]